VLFNSGVKTIDDVKTAPISKLVGLPLIGAKVAQKLKKQVGSSVEIHEMQSPHTKKPKKQRSLTDF
jgi:hypothetical protein